MRPQHCAVTRLRPQGACDSKCYGQCSQPPKGNQLAPWGLADLHLDSGGGETLEQAIHQPVGDGFDARA